MYSKPAKYHEDPDISSEPKSSQTLSGSSFHSHQTEPDVPLSLPASGIAGSSARLSSTEPIITKNSRELDHPDEDTSSSRGENESLPRPSRQQGKGKANTSNRLPNSTKSAKTSRKAFSEIAPNHVPSPAGPSSCTTTVLHSEILSEDLKPPSFGRYTWAYSTHYRYILADT